MNPITVDKLRVESVTGPTCYAGENGFSALTAYIQSNDSAIVKLLRTAFQENSVVTVRCAALEIGGRVTNIHSNPDGIKDAIAISVDDLLYYKPKS